MSNKTPEANAAATESAPKSSNERNPGFSHRAALGPGPRLRLLFSLTQTVRLLKRPKTYIIVGCVGLLLAPFFLYEQPSRALHHDGQTISYEVVKTEAAREKGLSGRASLPGNRGMLFVFEAPGKHCFWMKDTLIPLDMIWLDEKQRVVTIKEGVKPDTYPKDFCPDKPARYVVEVNAGIAKEAHLKIGQKLSVQ